MDRVSHPTAGPDRLFAEGTIVTADFLNDVQEEIMAVIEAAGIEPSALSREQLLAAIRALAVGGLGGSGPGGLITADDLAPGAVGGDQISAELAAAIAAASAEAEAAAEAALEAAQQAVTASAAQVQAAEQRALAAAFAGQAEVQRSAAEAARIRAESADYTSEIFAAQAIAAAGAAQANVGSEAVARAEADLALAALITTLEATVGDNAAAISAIDTAYTTADLALANSISSLSASVTAQFSTVTASISAEASARAAADSAIVLRTETLEAQVQTPVTGLIARIGTEETVRAAADAAVATRVDNVESVLLHPTTGLSNVAARVATVETAYVAADLALASQVNDVRASLNEGSTTNLLSNTDFAQGRDYWYSSNEAGYQFGVRILNSILSGSHDLERPLFIRRLAGTPYTSAFMVNIDRRTQTGVRTEWGEPCKAGEWLEVSANVGATNSSARVYLQFRDDAGVVLGNFFPSPTSHSANVTNNPAANRRMWVKAQAPTGATKAILVFQMVSAANEASESYATMLRPQLCRSSADATEPHPYVPGGSQSLGKVDAYYRQSVAALASDGLAIAQSVETLNASVAGNSAAITAESLARADADSALAVTVDTLSARTGKSNLVRTDTFHSGVGDWTQAQGAVTTGTSTLAPSGFSADVRSLAVTWLSENTGLLEAPVRLGNLRGRTLRISGWFRTNVSGAASIRLRIRFTRPDGSIGFSSAAFLGAGNGWTFASFDALITEDTISWQPQLAATNAGTYPASHRVFAPRVEDVTSVSAAEAQISTIQATKVDAAGAVAAVNTQVSAASGGAYASVNALTSAQITTAGKVSARFGLQVKAGSAGAVLELVAFDNGAIVGSGIELSASQIRLNGSVLLNGTTLEAALGNLAASNTLFFTGGSITIPVSIETTVASVTLPALGRNVIVDFRAIVTPGDGPMTIALKRDGVTIRSATYSGSVGAWIPIEHVGSAAAGSRVYTVTALNNGSAVSGRLNVRSLKVTEMRSEGK